MHLTMNAIEQDDADARVGAVTSRDELGDLAAQFDRLLDRLQAQAVAQIRCLDRLLGLAFDGGGEDGR